MRTTTLSIPENGAVLDQPINLTRDEPHTITVVSTGLTATIEALIASLPAIARPQA